ncbi:hypothetical protein [Thalassotalea euphylliae]|uniref:Uncharacterized protein n=1 Tax=Thalassotalea euphylliae TaxID=1655234 RepID=A0A3E0TZR9_9GAMM|nr:hypothetical protein [Thalassotalea euphylliae]REL30148.1 hypothetical protein DXX94_05215 [Thalassotalea euphylliae]
MKLFNFIAGIGLTCVGIVTLSSEVPVIITILLFIAGITILLTAIASTNKLNSRRRKIHKGYRSDNTGSNVSSHSHVHWQCDGSKSSSWGDSGGCSGDGGGGE